MGEPSGLTNIEALEHCKEADPVTKEYIMQQTMYRIKDPRKSLRFYTEVLGMQLLQKLDFPEKKYTQYYLGYENLKDKPYDTRDNIEWVFSRKGVIELMHNWGTETDPDTRFHNGNIPPKGYGHIGIAVPDVNKAFERFDDLNVAVVKRPEYDEMKGIAYIRDPDGYWIEILNPSVMADIVLDLCKKY